jgi:hypothetical protein
LLERKGGTGYKFIWTVVHYKPIEIAIALTTDERIEGSIALDYYDDYST